MSVTIYGLTSSRPNTTQNRPLTSPGEGPVPTLPLFKYHPTERQSKPLPLYARQTSFCFPVRIIYSAKHHFQRTQLIAFARSSAQYQIPRQRCSEYQILRSTPGDFQYYGVQQHLLNPSNFQRGLQPFSDWRSRRT